MTHNIPLPVRKTHLIRSVDFEANASISCFPNGRVDYGVEILRCAPGRVFQIYVQASFLRGGKRAGLSRQAIFYSNKPTVEGIPPGDAPYTGKSFPSDSAIYGVDNFTPMGGAKRL